MSLGYGRRRYVLRAGIIAGLAALIWLACGLRFIPEQSFGVIQGAWGGKPMLRVTGRWALAPPGLFTLATYPQGQVELGLPQAEEAMLRAPNGSRFGLRGFVRLSVQSDSWRELHHAAHGQGLQGVLIDAVREAAVALPAGRPGQSIPVAAERELELGLAAALDRRGIDMQELAVDSFDFLLADQGWHPGPDSRLLVLGLDGADWQIIDDLLARGRLPHIRRLLAEGARAKLMSIVPMLSPVIWTSVATGVEPGRHGILDFLVEGDGPGQRQPVTSAQRRSAAVWEILSREEIDVGVVGWWATWPADPVRGYMVSDRIAYQLFGFRADPEDAQGKTWPPALYEELRPLVKPPASIGWDRVRPYLEGERLATESFDADERRMLEDFRTLLASGETYLSLALSLRKRYAPRLEMVYFEGTDTIGHLFMPFRPPLLPGIDRARAESFGGMVDRYYELADSYIGELLRDRDQGWTVMILSDHGFASDATRPRSTDSRIGHGAAADWHRRFGVLLLAGAKVRQGIRLEEASIYDIAPTILALFGQPIPRSWPGRVLGEALTEQFLEAYPVRYRAEDPVRDELRAGGAVDGAAADLLEKLQSLGYVSQGAGPSEATGRNNAGLALLAQGRYAEAEREFRAALDQGAQLPLLRGNLALSLRMQGRVDEARRQFEALLEEPTTWRMAAHQLAQIDLEAGRLAPAEQRARDVLAREPGASDVRNTLGLILERKGALGEAEAEYRLAAELDPHAATALNNLGNLAKNRQAPDEAERWYLRALEADPYFVGAYNNLALVYQARGDMDRAIDLYVRALGKAPDNEVVLNNLASLYFAKGDLAQAQRLWQRLVEAAPRYVSPLNNLAGIEITRRRFAQAEALLGRALAIEPGYGDARINLSFVLAARGDVAAARGELQRAAQDPRAAPQALAQLGLLEQQQGRSAQALDAWRRSLSLNPDQPGLRRELERLQKREAPRPGA